MMKQITLLLAATAGCMLLGCGGSGKTNQAEWLIINYSSYGHVITVWVNGDEFNTYERPAGGFSMNPSYFKEGENEIKVHFVPRKGESSSGSIQFLFSPTMLPGEDPLPDVTIDDVDGYCEVVISVQIKDGVPVMTRRTRTEWATKNKTVKRFEANVQRDPKQPYSEKTVLWESYEKGKPCSEREILKGKLMAAKFYKPDGSVGATVSEGNGKVCSWYDSGKLESEVPVVNGKYHGTMKDYDREGKIWSETNYVNGEEVETE